MNLITKLAYNALTKTIQAIAPGGVSIRLAVIESEKISGVMGGFSSGGAYAGVISRVGDTVTVSFDGIGNGTKSGSSAATITMPALYRPTATRGGLISFSQNGNVRYVGIWTMNTAGTLSIYGDLLGSNITAGAGCGFNEYTTISWVV